MITKIKNLLKRILPPPTRTFLIIIDELLVNLSKKMDQIMSTIRYQHKESKKEIIEEFARITKNSELQQKDRYLDLAVMQKETDAHVAALLEQQQEQHQENKALHAELREQLKEQHQENKALHAELREQLKEQQQKQNESSEALHTEIQTSLEQLILKQNQQQEILEKMMARLVELQEATKNADREIAELERLNIREHRENAGVCREVLWAQIFNNAISGADWLVDKSFAPGRWAVGYPLLYVLYSVLSKAKPQSVLELGLGQSTQMITQYAAANPQVHHVVVEQNQQWSDFFRVDHEVAPNTEIKILECIEGTYKEDAVITVYKDFKNEVGHKKYDLILIDAPIYNKVSSYSRIDTISILPNSLAEHFVILMDDCSRPGEEKTAGEITAVLKESGINFVEGSYKGEKRIHIWCSEDQAYLCSL